MSDGGMKITIGRPGSVRLQTDPVCGMKVDPARAAAKIDYDGKTYFFCNAVCLEAFIREPSRYLLTANCPHANRQAQRL